MKTRKQHTRRQVTFKNSPITVSVEVQMLVAKRVKIRLHQEDRHLAFIRDVDGLVSGMKLSGFYPILDENAKPIGVKVLMSKAFGQLLFADKKLHVGLWADENTLHPISPVIGKQYQLMRYMYDNPMTPEYAATHRIALNESVRDLKCKQLLRRLEFIAAFYEELLTYQKYKTEIEALGYNVKIMQRQRPNKKHYPYKIS